MSPRTSSIIGGVGRTFITLGCLTLAFAAFQLWGTGVAENRAQSDLEDDFVATRAAYAEFAASSGVDVATIGDSVARPTTTILPAGDDDRATTTTTPPGPAVPAAQVPSDLLPEAGDALGVIRIAKLGVDKVIIAGTRRDDLRKGPGHYATTPLPGQAGNAAIAGHRTTYGAPFGDIDLLEPGDRIEVETFQGVFYYEVIAQESDVGISGHRIVTPYQTEVLDDYGDNRLTLTACHPKYSARQRIVVQARLIDPPAARVELDIDHPYDDDPSPEDLAFEATGVDPETGEIDPDIVAEIEDDPVVSDPSGRSDGSINEAGEVLDESLGWNFDELVPFSVWAVLTASAAGLVVLVAERWRRRTSYAIAAPAVAALLFVTFVHLDRMLPAF